MVSFCVRHSTVLSAGIAAEFGMLGLYHKLDLPDPVIATRVGCRQAAEEEQVSAGPVEKFRVDYKPPAYSFASVRAHTHTSAYVSIHPRLTLPPHRHLHPGQPPLCAGGGAHTSAVHDSGGPHFW